MDDLLSSCISVARSLRLHTAEALDHLCASQKKRIMGQRACWLLDCIDKGNAMRTRKFEVSENIGFISLRIPDG